MPLTPGTKVPVLLRSHPLLTKNVLFVSKPCPCNWYVAAALRNYEHSARHMVRYRADLVPRNHLARGRAESQPNLCGEAREAL